MSTTPKPTTSRDRAAADLDDHGFAILAGALDRDEVNLIRRRLVEAADAAEAAGAHYARSKLSTDRDHLNRRIRRLFNLDPIFVGLALRDEAQFFVRRAIGDQYLISNFSANIVRPGGSAGGMHADQRYALEPWPNSPLAINVGWLLDDFTEEVGATRVVPDSHRLCRNADSDGQYETVAVEAPAGSIMIMDGRLWHQAGANRTVDKERAALFCYYVRNWIRPQVNWNASLAPEVVDSATDEFLDLLGYRVGLVDDRVGDTLGSKPIPTG
jgi:ectoine hydroxylase-related dioxygenase (phytanoyl-CoA dioxygenase family)